MDFDLLRAEMVENQLIPRRISDPRVLEAFRNVPRHKFVPENMHRSAYEDCALPIGEGQTISQPYMVAVMTELLRLKGDEKVLEIGTGSGYQAAILSELCREVITIERIQELSEKAEKNIRDLDINNIKFVVGDGSQGFAEAAPYEGIIVTAACPKIPTPLIGQLKEGGRLVVPVGNMSLQVLTTVTKHGDKTSMEESVPCVFVPLLGKFGFDR